MLAACRGPSATAAPACWWRAVRQRCWANAIASLHDFPQTRTDMGRAASVFAESFGWEKTAAQTMASYDLALKYQYEAPPGC